ncbi:MAG: hypothetical protein AMXMBFR59_04250 [Rhodanobacteraceae bacterium]
MEARLLAPLLAAGSAILAPAAHALDVELVNRTTIVAPLDSNGPTYRAVVTPDGRFSLFTSLASNLVAGDTNRNADLFLHDATTGLVERVNVGTGGNQAEGSAGSIAGLSDDGRYVVFDSAAQNLVSTATSGYQQVYLRDRAAGTTTLLSRVGGNAAQSDSANAQISSDGRYVVFDTAAAFDGKDTNGVRDIYRLDRQTGQFLLISVSAEGRIGNGESYEAQISADGGSVAFYTRATNLVPDDTNNAHDLVLRKPAAGSTQRISVRTDGSPLSTYPNLSDSDALSADGRFVLMNVYEAADPADTNGQPDGYLFDSQDGSVRRVTLGIGNAQIAGFSLAAGLSRDAARVIYQAHAADVIPGQPMGNPRAYVRELATDIVTHVTFRDGAEVAGDSISAPVMASNGSVVVAATLNGNFVTGDRNDMSDIIRQDGLTSASQRLTAPMAGSAVAAGNHDSGSYVQGVAASADARFVAFGSLASNLVPGDLNGVNDIFVRDRLLGTTERVSVYSNGSEGFCGSFGANISDDGRYVVFYSCTPFDLATPSLRMDVYRHDRLTHTTSLISRALGDTAANGFSTHPALSADGRIVAFASCASDLVAIDLNGLCDIFVRDLDTGVTVLATPSVGAGGANQNTSSPGISRNGQRVFYASDATNLIASDTNASTDVFVFDRGTQTVELVSASSQGEQGNNYSFFSGASADGSQVLFLSAATNLVDNALFSAVYVRHIDTDTTELVSRTSDGSILTGAWGPSAISTDGARVAFVSSALNSGPPAGFKLMLYERTPARLGLVRTMDAQFPISVLYFVGGGSQLLLSSAENTFVPDDANNYFMDVFLLDRIEDHLFADGFEPKQSAQ